MIQRMKHTDEQWRYSNAIDDFANLLDAIHKAAEWEGDEPDWHREMRVLRQLLEVGFGASPTEWGMK